MSAITAKIMLKLWFGKIDSGNMFTIEDVLDFFKKEEKYKAKQILKQLRQQEFINHKEDYNGSLLLSLSEKGRLRALNYVFRRLDNKKEKWDRKWRMISFDIPNSCVKGRKALSYRLKTGGFYKLQESLFVYPYDCKKEIEALVKLFKIEKYICFGLLESINRQNELLRHFKLL